MDTSASRSVAISDAPRAAMSRPFRRLSALDITRICRCHVQNQAEPNAWLASVQPWIDWGKHCGSLKNCYSTPN